MSRRFIALVLALVPLIPAALMVADNGFSLSFAEYFSDFRKTAALVATLILIFLLCYFVISRLLSRSGEQDQPDTDG